MITGSRKNISRLLIFAFLFFLIPSDTFSVKGDEKGGLKLINEAENLFRNYRYSESVKKFNEAKKYIKQEINLSRLYLGLSRSYYAMGLMAKVKAEIRLLALLSIKEPFNEDEFPRGFMKVYKSIHSEIEQNKIEGQIVKTEDKPESLYQVEKTGEETKKVTKKDSIVGVIEKPGKKKKKKKSLLLPIVLGAVALGAAAMLLGKKSDGGGDTASNTASVHIASTPSGASVFVDGASKGVTTPCDIKVSEGSREIRVQIEGWGETTKTKSFSKDNSYTLNAELAPYKYESALSFTIDPVITYYSWDADHSGNIYGVYVQNSNLYLNKYSSEGVELVIAKKIKSGTFNMNNYRVHYNNNTQQFYVYEAYVRSCYVFDSDGNFLTKPSLDDVSYFSELNNSSDIYLVKGGRIVYRYSSSFNFLDNFLKGQNLNYANIKCSDDGQHIFIGNKISGKLMKYDVSGSKILDWEIKDGYSTTFQFLTSNGSGEIEKVFLRTIKGSEYRIEIYDGKGDFLTAASNSNYVGKIAEDNLNNFYVYLSKSKISRYEPSSETEGNGSWESSSVASTRSRTGPHGITRIDPLQKNRSNKPDIIKSKKKKIIR